MQAARHAPSAGFTLIEVLVALALLVSMALGVAQLIAASTRAVQQSKAHAAAVILAAAKMDELRSLAWTFEPAVEGMAAVPRSDRDTDVSRPDHPPGGAGLSASPDDALSVNTVGYVDHLDASGRWVGNEREPPSDAVFVRRWAVRPVAADPERTLVLQVLVLTVADARSGTGVWTRRSGGEALLVSVRTRAGR